MAPKTEQEKHPEMFFISPKGHPVDRIIVHQTEDYPKEGRYVGLNGHNYLIPAEVEVDISRPVRLALDTRIQSFSTMSEDSDGKPVHHTRNVRRVPYTLIAEDVGGVPLAPEAAEEEART